MARFFSQTAYAEIAHYASSLDVREITNKTSLNQNRTFLHEGPFFSSKMNGKRMFSTKGSFLVTYLELVI